MRTIPTSTPPTDAEAFKLAARRQWDAGLPALAGARVTAHVRASVDVLNDWLGDVLRQLASRAVAPRGDAATPDMGKLVGLVRHLRVGAGPGVVTLDVEAGAGD